MVKQAILHIMMVVGFCILDLVWAIGASVTAGALSA